MSMRFSEVFLRLGTGLVAWIILLTYFIWLGVVGQVGCGPDGDAIHRLVLGVAPFALIAAFLLRMTLALPDVHSILRWGIVLLALLVPSAVMAVWRVAENVWMNERGICGPDAPAVWETVWPFAQIVVIAVVLYRAVASFRAGQ